MVEFLGGFESRFIDAFQSRREIDLRKRYGGVEGFLAVFAFCFDASILITDPPIAVSADIRGASISSGFSVIAIWSLGTRFSLFALWACKRGVVGVDAIDDVGRGSTDGSNC